MLLLLRTHSYEPATVIPTSSVALVGAYGEVDGKTDILKSDEWFTGTDYSVGCSIVEDDGTEKDVTDWSLSWMVKKRASDADGAAVIVKVTDDGGIVIVSGEDGAVRIFIDAEDTVDLRAGVYVHELKRMDTGYRIPLVNGYAVLQQSAHE
jgi:hypothetical protein